MKRREKPSLDGVYDKIRRAKAHRDHLQRLIEPISDLDPHPLKGEVRDDGREHLYWWENPPVLDPDTELVLGDCVHNLRSALDHLVYQLAVLNKKTPSPKSAFPIHDLPPRSSWKQLRRRTPLVVQGVSKAANRVIEDIQPYKRGEIGRWLAVLRDLDNIDKHRHLILAITAIDSGSTAWFGEEPPYGEPYFHFVRKTAVHGQVGVRVVWPEPRPDLDPQLHFTLGVRLDPRIGKRFARRPVRGILGNLVWVVEDAIVENRFRSFFGS